MALPLPAAPPLPLCRLSLAATLAIVSAPPPLTPKPRSPPKPWIQCAKKMTGNVQLEKCLARFTSNELGKRKRSLSW